MENLRASLAEIDKEEFERVADAVVNAKTVYIIGVRSSASLAGFKLLLKPNFRQCASCADVDGKRTV